MDRIGEYLVKRLVGEGGMGKVYEAEERLSKRRVALKVLRAELARSEDGRRLFLNEMQILAHLEHASIVRSLSSMEHDGQLVLVLEFLEGRTLRDEIVARGRLPLHEAVEIVSRIAEALEAAHAQTPPIVHRDLKPENVMLLQGGQGALKVMDFGIAKVLEAAHATNTQSIGTLQYMSPEQIDAQSIDARSDLYALGLVFYELLSGAPPFQSASPRELLNMQCTAEPPELPEEVSVGMPFGVEEVLRELLAKAREDRPRSASEVVSALAPFRPARGRKVRTTIPGSTASPVPLSSAGEAASTGAKARTGDTLVSTPHSPRPERAEAKREAVPAKLDTVALVEQRAAPRALPTWAAFAIIGALSIVAGVCVYFLRTSATSSDTPARASASASAPRR